jgi:hypothetical protein
MSIASSSISQSTSSIDNVPVLNARLAYKTTDRINSVLMFNLSKNSIIYQNENCLNFIVFNCYKIAIIICINGKLALKSWRNYFLIRFYICIIIKLIF